MNRLLVVGTENDIASLSLFDNVLALLKEKVDDERIVKSIVNNIELTVFKKMNEMMYDELGFLKVKESLLDINIDSYSNDFDSICFLSKHAAKSENNSITMHAIGNFGKALFGGIDNKLVSPEATLLSSLYRVASKKTTVTNIGGYELSMEATHHGPYSSKKCVFYELGSTQTNWSDSEAAKALSEIFIEALYKDRNYPSFFGIGSSHYCKGFESFLNEYDFAGSCPEYALADLKEEQLLFLSQYVAKFIFHPNVKKSEKKRIITLLEQNNLTYETLN